MIDAINKQRLSGRRLKIIPPDSLVSFYRSLGNYGGNYESLKTGIAPVSFEYYFNGGDKFRIEQHNIPATNGEYDIPPAPLTFAVTTYGYLVKAVSADLNQYLILEGDRITIKNYKQQLYDMKFSAVRSGSGEYLPSVRFDYKSIEGGAESGFINSVSGGPATARLRIGRVYSVSPGNPTNTSFIKYLGPNPLEFCLDEAGQFKYRSPGQEWTNKNTPELFFNYHKNWNVWISKQAKDKPGVEQPGSTLQCGWPGAYDAKTIETGTPGSPSIMNIAENIPYTIREIKTPAGYNKADDLVFQIDQNGVLSILGGDGTVVQKHTYADDDPSTIIMLSQPNAPLGMGGGGEDLPPETSLPEEGMKTNMLMKKSSAEVSQAQKSLKPVPAYAKLSEAQPEASPEEAKASPSSEVSPAKSESTSAEQKKAEGEKRAIHPAIVFIAVAAPVLLAGAIIVFRKKLFPGAK
ncbi:MAG: hypothetical protein GX684_00560 [Ruminococcaceae bacterium]|nr:hypothetical protein [Oscillospiraceae bacterium]